MSDRDHCRHGVYRDDYCEECSAPYEGVTREQVFGEPKPESYTPPWEREVLPLPVQFRRAPCARELERKVARQ